MAKESVEDIKLASNGLRGHIAEGLADSTLTHYEEAENVLMKFHGTYQQDDRDKRAALNKAKQEKAWSFMVRTRMPGGRMTAEQYLLHDKLGDTLANGTIRLTTRQGVQFHGVLKGGLKEVIATINRCGLTTMGACGDVVRNIMGPAAPLQDTAHQDAQQLAEEISRQFLWRSSAYCDIWLDGEKLDLLEKSTDPAGVADDLYGKVYLPRKFKMGIAVSPSNDVDMYSQDVGFVPELKDGKVDGYTIVIGGGFGMSHGQLNTRPFLAQPFGYVKRADVPAVTEAIVKTQRDHGNREERKNARMKYLVEKEGIPWFIDQVKSRLRGVEIAAPKPIHFETVADKLGWHEQGDGNWYCAVYVSMGRVVNVENGPQYQSAFREIVSTLRCPVVVTPNTNLIFKDIAVTDRPKIDAILAKYNVPHSEGMTAAHQVAHACVALPTCGLSLSESERVFGGLMDRIDVVLRELGLGDEPILFRMTGCPNGCARPYNADIGFVGRAPGKYAMFVGGSITGDRLAGLEYKSVPIEEIPAKVHEILADFKANRQPGERFGAYWTRFRGLGPAPSPEQFHIEFTERAAKLAGQTVGAAEG